MKSSGPLIHFGKMDLPASSLGVSLIRLPPREGLPPVLLGLGVAPKGLASDFRQTTPAKPKSPPAAKIQNGLSLVANASEAATIVSSAATQLRSEARARINALAPIRPMDNGTSAAWMMAGQGEPLERRNSPLT